MLLHLLSEIPNRPFHGPLRIIGAGPQPNDFRGEMEKLVDALSAEMES